MNIIFDLDGTIGNTLPLCIAAFRNSIEPIVGKTLSDREITEHFGPSEEGTIKSLVQTASYEQALKDYLRWYEDLHQACAHPFDGMLEILTFLRSKKVFIGLVTGKGKESTLITLKKYEILDYFDSIETGSSQGPVKPQRLRKIVREVDRPIESFLYVGDSPSDVVACREVGMRIVGAAWAETADKEKLIAERPDFYFESVPEFQCFLENLLSAKRCLG